MPSTPASDFCLFGYFKDVIDFDTQIPHGGLQLGVSKQQLHSSKVLGAPIDQRERFRAWRASVSPDEYESAVLVDLRLRDGRPVTGGASGQTLPIKASEMVKSLRQKLIDTMNGADQPPSTLGEESQASEL